MRIPIRIEFFENVTWLVTDPAYDKYVLRTVQRTVQV